ncbi:Uncharacterised protein [Halioglobus japonicus]|nr:Uncharacterised protein [Halioglobus japonicus]
MVARGPNPADDFISSSHDCKTLEPSGVKTQINAPQFTITVNQNTLRKDVFLDLCRSACWATSAPGQPPINDSRCSFFSGVLQSPSLAAVLSKAYAKNVTQERTRYTTRTNGGRVLTKTNRATKLRNASATKLAVVFPPVAFCTRNRSPGNRAS